MKKMKKIFAMLLAFTMVLGMTMTASAYESIEIEINGAGSSAVFEKLHLIEADTEKDTGWDFTTDAIAEDFTTAFGVSDAQTAIWMLIGAQDERDNSYEVTLPSGVSAAEDDEIAEALANVKAGHEFDETDAVKEVLVNAPGVYYIAGFETNYVYSPMAAYVSFVYSADGVPTSLKCGGVTAKKAPTTIDKDATSVEGYDEITEIGRTETYTVTSTVPFLPTTDSNRTYQIIDELSGATYVSTSTETAKVDVNVVVGDNLFVEKYVLDTTTTGDGKSTFTLDLSADLLGEGENLTKTNQYANQTLTITYQAKVTDVTVHNDVYAGDGTNDGKDKYGSNHEDLFTGKITLTKYAEDADNENLADNKKLSGAVFKVYKTADNITSWATFDSNNKLTGWVEKEADATGVRTSDVEATLGQVTVSGLDSGTYYFKEVVAPEGYSINEGVVNATLALASGVTEATAELTATTFMVDTQLIALPSTGGIGTTIFTVAGCGIMIAAAFFFFANRKKENE